MAAQCFFSAARNSGIVMRNHVRLCRRAIATAGRCDAGRMGMMLLRASSSAYSRAASRRNASPFRRPIVESMADVSTRIDTASGVTGGMSSVASICSIPDIQAANHAKLCRYKNNVTVTTLRTLRQVVAGMWVQPRSLNAFTGP